MDLKDEQACLMDEQQGRKDKRKGLNDDQLTSPLHEGVPNWERLDVKKKEK